MGALVQAASSGDKRKALLALRSKLAYTIETSKSGRDIAALSRRLMDVMNELDKLPDEDREPSKFDRLKKRAGQGP
jgi:CRISPR/Cas system CSM-associated protein Csm2 small subunit